MDMHMNKNGTMQPADELRDIVGKAEELLGTLGEGGDAALGELRSRVNATMSKAKAKLSDLQTQGQELASQGAKGTDEYVRANPWVSVGIAAAVGAMLGALVSRRL
jgi:ElaB/YqjD/DUF883 family membrane-anchored ribosome-binding protein